MIVYRYNSIQISPIKRVERIEKTYKTISDFKKDFCYINAFRLNMFHYNNDFINFVIRISKKYSEQIVFLQIDNKTLIDNEIMTDDAIFEKIKNDVKK